MEMIEETEEEVPADETATAPTTTTTTEAQPAEQPRRVAGKLESSAT